MTVRNPIYVKDENEFVNWFSDARQGDACVYYGYSLKGRNDPTIGALREVCADARGIATQQHREVVHLADRVFRESTARISNAFDGRLGTGKLLLVSRRFDNRRELMAVRSHKRG